MAEHRRRSTPGEESDRRRLWCLAAGLLVEMSAYATWRGDDRMMAVALTLSATYLLSAGLWLTLVVD